MTDLNTLKTELAQEISSAHTLQILDDVRVSALGKKGRVTELMKTLGGMDPEQRKVQGATVAAIVAVTTGTVTGSVAGAQGAATKTPVDSFALPSALPAATCATRSSHERPPAA
jgi:phenylalanyl-tRNA synthetase alpha chain